MYKLLSFDVYGTLVNTPPTNAKAFRLILEEAGAPNVDALAFYQFWEGRNIVHYREPYRSYREIGELSLEEAFENFGIAGGKADLIERYFDLFGEMQLYPDVLPTLEKLAGKYRLAVVSNIDDDLLRATRLHREFDLICTAERACGYKPDGTLFRYLIANSGVGVPEILHSGQSQFTDMVGGKPLGLTVCWINRRGIDLDPSVPPPDHIFSDIQSLLPLLSTADPQTIYHWRRLDDRITTSGQPSEPQLADIHALGVRHVVNLGLHSHEKALPDEAASVGRLGMTYIHIPVDFQNPTDQDFDKFCAVMADLEDVPVHVHCIANYRVSAFFYRYRRDVLGVDEKQARAEMEDVWHPEGVWATFVNG